MKVGTAVLQSAAKYSQSNHYRTPKLDREGAGDYEERTWRDRIHATTDGKVYIPAICFKNCITECAAYFGKQIPGKGKRTYTKHFKAGFMITEDIILPLRKEEVDPQWLFVPSDGQPGGTNRVDKCFPLIHEWKGNLNFTILDDTITEKAWEEHLRDAGMFIGIGRWRPARNGMYGRFIVKSIDWS